MNLSTIKNNPKNPRVINNDKFKKLVNSIRQFPQMMSKRPIVCITAPNGVIHPIGGNMRLKALKELGYKYQMIIL